MTLTITDLFCGAGGSSAGAEQVPGVRVRMAANHWTLAVQTHNTNLPHADHDVADISQVDPRRYPRTDLLWASPECTHHSGASGQRRVDAQPDLFEETLPTEAAERSRSTMWDVLRFADVHEYRGLVVENVVEVRSWRMWPAWLLGLDNLGYDHHVVYLNSMFAQAAGPPAPQSRDRLYVVAWRRGGRAPNLRRWTRPPAWCPTCDQIVQPVQAWKNPDRPYGRHRQQYLYRCPTTRCRGAEVFPGVLPAAVAIDWTLTGERIGDRTKPLAAKTMARIAAGLARYARTSPVDDVANGVGQTIWPGTDPAGRWPGQAAWPAGQRGQRPVANGQAQPALSGHNPPGLGHTGGTTALTSTVPGPAVAGGQPDERSGTTGTPNRHSGGLANAANRHSVGQASTANRNRVGQAGMLVPAGGTWNSAAATVDEPFRTRTTRDTEALVVPVGSRDDLAARPVGDPARTQTTRAQDALVVPLRNNGVARGAGTAPIVTVAAAGNHHALVVRNNTGGAEMSTPTTEPIRTLTTSGHQSLVRWDHLLVPYHHTGVARPVDQPLITQTTRDRAALLGPQIAVEDCTFRMLAPHEIQAAMAFHPDYVVLGNKRERVRQLGNAVTPPAARDLIAALAEAITGEAIAR